jgi:hypothetical protein
MSISSFPRIQKHCPEPESPERFPSIEEEAVDILLTLDEEDARQPGPGLDAWPNSGEENVSSQPSAARVQEAEKPVPQKVPAIRPSEVARLLLKQAAHMKRRP